MACLPNTCAVEVTAPKNCIALHRIDALGAVAFDGRETKEMLGQKNHWHVIRYISKYTTYIYICTDFSHIIVCWVEYL